MKERKFINLMLIASIFCSSSIWMYNSNEESSSNSKNTIADLKEIKQDLSTGYGKAYLSPAEDGAEDVKYKGTIITSNGVISFDGTNSVGEFTPME